jgi:hypothetical protein
MANDDRNDRDRERERARDDDRERGRGPEWRGDEGFGGGWGNQTPRPHRMGDRNWRGESDDPDYGLPRYGEGGTWQEAGGGTGPTTAPGSFDVAPGYDASMAGPRFDRIDVGSTGTHGVHEVSSLYGGDLSGPMGIRPGGGYGSSARLYAELGRRGGGGQRHPHDPHYAEWRSRQIEQLDRDYDEYSREHQARFEQEFGAWRERRGQQRQAVGRVTEHMEVVGSDGSHVGIVDHARGESIILTRSDPSAGGHHHTIPCSWVESVDDKVKLNLSADEAKQRWREEEESGALFDRGGGRDEDRQRDRTYTESRDRDRDRDR